jgi:hypothetical protein
MINNRKSRAFALPLVLIALIIGGVLVFVAYEVVLNMFATSEVVISEIELYHAALDGVEKAKTWIRTKTDEDGRLPRWSASDSSGELGTSDVGGSGDEYYKVLLVEDLSGNTFPAGDVYDGPISVEVKIYDMGYFAANGIDYVQGFPPRLIYEVETGQMSEHMSSTYVGSNRGEGSTGSSGGVTLGYYLIRSEASFEGRTEVVDQSMIMRL